MKYYWVTIEVEDGRVERYTVSSSTNFFVGKTHTCTYYERENVHQFKDKFRNKDIISIVECEPHPNGGFTSAGFPEGIYEPRLF